MSQMQDIISRLRIDPVFLQDFADAPRAALSRRGYSVDAVNLPDRIDAQLLKERIDAVAASIEAGDDVWEGIGPAGERRLDWSIVAVVIYGTTPVIGTVVVGPPTVVVGPPTTVIVGPYIVGAAPGARSPTEDAATLKALRTLSRLPKAELRFAIRGPDGLEAQDVSLDVLEAFLARSN